MIKFKCFIDGVANETPIHQTKQVSFIWAHNAKKYYQETDDLKKTTSCPGIFSLLNSGWIQRSYQDFFIDTRKTKNVGFEWNSILDQSKTKNGNVIGDYISAHSPDQLANFFDDWKDKNRFIVKIQSPWFVEIPKGFALLMMPIPYNDNQNFTSAAGLLRGNKFLNVQLFWHNNNELVKVDKGTPLQQYILVKDIDQNYEIETVKDAKEYLREL